MPRFEQAIRRFEAANSLDPHREKAGGREVPRELAHAQWLSKWVERLAPDASEALRLASHCQHLCRWEIPRDSYPKGRAGYLKWREDLKKFHAEQSAGILREVGYDDATIARVRALNLKKDLGADPEVQVLEDALCLIFFEHQFADLAAQHPEEKMIGILQKTWKKMSPKARQEAMKLTLGERERELVKKAVG